MNLMDLEAVTGVRGLLSEHTDVPFNRDLYDALNKHDRVNVTERGFVKLWSYRVRRIEFGSTSVLPRWSF